LPWRTGGNSLRFLGLAPGTALAGRDAVMQSAKSQVWAAVIAEGTGEPARLVNTPGRVAFRAVVRTVPDDALIQHSGRGDLARWVRDVFRDAELARQIGKAEVRFRRGELRASGRCSTRSSAPATGTAGR
jgi:hypothetical protein